MTGRENIQGRSGKRSLGRATSSGRRTHQGAVLTVLVLTLMFVWCAGPSIACAAPAGDPHAPLTSSPIGCPSCHLFLPGPASDYACVRCHILPDGGGRTVYGGEEANYRNEDGFGHNDPATVSCLNCHSIHGPTIGSPALSGMLLRELDYQSEALEVVDLATAPHDTALSVWCTGCHKEWPEPYVPGESAVHPFAPKDPGETWNDCASCLSCHAAPGGFPHYTAGADAGLVGASSASAERIGVASRWVDGVCLGCHRSVQSGYLRGVGISY